MGDLRATTEIEPINPIGIVESARLMGHPEEVVREKWHPTVEVDDPIDPIVVVTREPSRLAGHLEEVVRDKPPPTVNVDDLFDPNVAPIGTDINGTGEGDKLEGRCGRKKVQDEETSHAELDTIDSLEVIEPSTRVARNPDAHVQQDVSSHVHKCDATPILGLGLGLFRMMR